MQDFRTSRDVTIALLAMLVVGCSASPAPGVAPSAASQASAPTIPVASPVPTQPKVAEPTTTAAGMTPSPAVESVRPGLILYECPSGSGSGICQMRGDASDQHVVVPYDPAIGGLGTYPEWSPDGQHFTYNYSYNQDGQRWEAIWIADRDGSHGHVVGQPARSAASEWRDANTLLLYAVDAQGEFVQVSYHLDSGTLTEGTDSPVDVEYYFRSWSPDGSRMAIISADEHEVSIVDCGSGNVARVFVVPAGMRYDTVGDPVWSPDGQQLVFGDLFLLEDGPPFGELYVVDADGGGLRRLTDFAAGYTGGGSPTRAAGLAWSPDGRWLAFLLAYEGQGTHLAVMPAQGGQVVDLGVDCTNAKVDPVWSPDSRELAFVSNRPFADGRLGDNHAPAGHWEIYTVDIHTQAVHRLTSDSYTEMNIDWR